MNDGRNHEQEGDGSGIEGSFEERILALLQGHADLIQTIADNQSQQLENERSMLEMIQQLTARVERLEQDT